MERSTPIDDRPLCVDLDGTLLATDSLYELVAAFGRERPLELFRLPGWLRGGRAALKRRLTEQVALDPARLPYREAILAFLAAERERGRTVMLVTAADRSVAEAIAAHVGVFSAVMASDGRNNLKGAAKARALVERFGEGGFEYLGDARADLAVWQAAGGASLVAAGRRLHALAAAQGPVLRTLAPRPDPRTRVRHWLRLVRARGWLWNAWVVAPALLAVLQPGSMFGLAAGSGSALRVAATAIAFCGLDSAMGIARQLWNLAADRASGVAGRPLATGAVGILPAMAGAAVALLALLPAALLGPGALWLLWLGEVARARASWHPATRRPAGRALVVLLGVALRVLAGALVL